MANYVDNSKEPPAVLSFCSGYGGIELGLERVFGEINVLAHVEIEAYAAANLLKNMETGQMAPSPIWTNLKTFPLGPFRGKVEILTGGYPCQPFSRAGQRFGEKDPRHLWPYFRAAIDIIRPRLCFFENVEGHITEGLYDVLDDLGGLGYKSTWGIFSAAECGFNHERQRVFILADSSSVRSQRCPKNYNNENRAQTLQKKHRSVFVTKNKGSSGIWAHEGFQSQSVLPRGNDGLRDWHDRIKLLGNGVVPHTAELAFKTLMKELENG